MKKHKCCKEWEDAVMISTLHPPAKSLGYIGFHYSISNYHPPVNFCPWCGTRIAHEMEIENPSRFDSKLYGKCIRAVKDSYTPIENYGYFCDKCGVKRLETGEAYICYSDSGSWRVITLGRCSCDTVIQEVKE